MNTRRIGSLEVTVVGIGCNNFGRELDLTQTRAVVHAALDAGVRFFDTADTYGVPKGLSEQYLGAALRTRRDEVVIATKVGSWIDGKRGGARPEYIRSAVEACLTRLATDRIDLIQLHWPDPATPIADTLGAFQDLLDEGKVREIGCSNFSAAQLREAADAGDPARRRFISVQNEYSLLAREAELQVLPACRELGMSFLPYFPLFNGMLTGKYRRGATPPDHFRLANRGPEVVDRAFTERNFDLVDQLDEFVKSRGHTLLELALSWLLTRPEVPSVIAGVRTPDQVRGNAAGAGWSLDRSDLAELDRLTAPVPIA